MNAPTPLPASSRSGTGPADLTSFELGRFGLGIVVRHLRGEGAAVARSLSRVYCLFCGIAIDHELRADRWWLCRNACNPLERRPAVLEDPLVADIRRLDLVASRLRLAPRPAH